MRVFVTGASGFVGSAVVQDLLGATGSGLIEDLETGTFFDGK